MRKRRFETAATHLQTALYLQPDNADVHINYATVALKCNDESIAIEHS